MLEIGTKINPLNFAVTLATVMPIKKVVVVEFEGSRETDPVAVARDNVGAIWQALLGITTMANGQAHRRGIVSTRYPVAAFPRIDIGILRSQGYYVTTRAEERIPRAR